MGEIAKAAWQVLVHSSGDKKRKTRIQFHIVNPILKRILKKNKQLGEKALFTLVTPRRLNKRPYLVAGEWCNESDRTSVEDTYLKMLANSEAIERKLDELLKQSIDDNADE